MTEKRWSELRKKVKEICEYGDATGNYEPMMQVVERMNEAAVAVGLPSCTPAEMAALQKRATHPPTLQQPGRGFPAQKPRATKGRKKANA